MKLTSILIILLFAFTLAACGGGGSSGPAPGNDNGDGDGDGAAMMCPDGQTGTPPNCEAPGAAQAEIDAEAMKLAADIGLNKDGEAIPVPAADFSTDPGITVMNGKITTGTKDESFMASSMDVATISGWDSDATTRTVKAVTDEIVLYSNVDDPTDVSYSDYFDDSDTNEDGRQLQGDANSAVEVTLVTTDSDENDAGDITFTAGFDVSKENAGHLVFSGFDADPNTVLVMPADDTGTTGTKENERAGSFFGIDGKFVCTADGGCRGRVTPDGGWDFTGDLKFEPDEIELTGDDATKVEGVIPDPDYLVFGYWLEATTKDGKETYAFSPYAMGTMAYGGTNNVPSGTAVGGKATYEGPATGMYVKKTLTTDGGTVTGGAPFSTGQFTADAALTAYFSGTSVAAVNENTVHGTISNFMDGGTSINDGWELTLGKSRIDITGEWGLDSAGGNAATETEKTHGIAMGNDRHTGDWTVTFYGSAAAGDNPATDIEETDFTPQPGSVAGTFNGHFQDGHVAGAFGATKE